MKQGVSDKSRISRRADQRLWVIIIGFTTLLCGLLFIAGSGYAGRQTAVGIAPEAVVMAIRLQSEYEQPHRLAGLVESQRLARLGFEMSGQLSTLHVEEGDSVLKGELLAQLDTSRLRARKTELEASLSRAEAEVRLASLTQSRLAPLVEKNVASAQQLDEAVARSAIATAQASEVRAALQSVDVELAKSQIRAPFDGRIGSREASKGTIVSAGATVFLLNDTGSLHARFAVPESLAEHVNLNQQVSVTTANGVVAGRITHILPSRNRATRTRDILVSLPDPSAELLTGDMVSTQLTTLRSATGAWVPVAALSNGLRGLWTLTVVTKDEEPVVQSRQIEVLYSDGERAYVTGAIEDGDNVVIQGNQRFVPGQSVQVRKGQDGAAYE